MNPQNSIEQKKEVIVKLVRLCKFQNEVKLNNRLFRDIYIYIYIFKARKLLIQNSEYNYFCGRGSRCNRRIYTGFKETDFYFVRLVSALIINFTVKVVFLRNRKTKSQIESALKKQFM